MLRNMHSRLVVSLAGVDDTRLDRSAEFAADLHVRGVPLSLLVPPVGGARSATARWLAEHAPGDCLVLHGFVDDTGSRARHSMASVALPAHEAGLRLIAAQAALEGMVLRGADCFVPRRWPASRGTLLALRRAGFRICADSTAVHDLPAVLRHPGRVLRPWLGQRGEPWVCRALVLGAARIARRGGLLRLTVHAADLERPGVRPAVLDAVDIALHHRAAPTSYLGLAAPVPARRLALADEALWSQTA